MVSARLPEPSARGPGSFTRIPATEPLDARGRAAYLTVNPREASGRVRRHLRRPCSSTRLPGRVPTSGHKETPLGGSRHRIHQHGPPAARPAPATTECRSSGRNRQSVVDDRGGKAHRLTGFTTPASSRPVEVAPLHGRSGHAQKPSREASTPSAMSHPLGGAARRAAPRYTQLRRSQPASCPECLPRRQWWCARAAPRRSGL